jgi:hypothetical protein
MRSARLRGVLNRFPTFSPLDLSPALWLDAADTTTITESSGSVSQWDDKSGNARNLVQANSVIQPSTGTATINGLNVINFTGSGARRLARQNDNILQNVGGGTIFAVVNGTYSSAFGTFVLITTNNTASFARCYLGNNSGTITSGGRRLDDNAFQSVASASVTNNTPVVAAAFYDYANAALRVSVNGTQTTRTGGFQTAGNTSNTASRIVLGANDGAAEIFTGVIAEIIVTARVLTTDEITSTENYLRTKWNVY